MMKTTVSKCKIAAYNKNFMHNFGLKNIIIRQK